MLKTLDKLYHNIWFNAGYMVAAFIFNLILQGLGWGMTMLYLMGAAWLDMDSRKIKPVVSTNKASKNKLYASLPKTSIKQVK